jgi:hypothetical protein
LAASLIPAATADAREAPQYESLARQLSEWGLLRGTGDGFALERETTRIEALVMLLRLLGLEEQALAQDAGAAHPFRDVPAWANPHVAYAWANGLTNGLGDDRFGSQEPVTARQYFTFVLRALGYSDSAGDFTWRESVRKAVEIGMAEARLYLDDATADARLIRDNLVHISYHALFQPVKGGTEPLLTHLLPEQADSGAIRQPEPSRVLVPVQSELHPSAGVPLYYTDAETFRTYFPDAVYVMYGSYRELKNSRLPEEEARHFDGIRMALSLADKIDPGRLIGDNIGFPVPFSDRDPDLHDATFIYNAERELIGFAFYDGLAEDGKRFAVHTALPPTIGKFAEQARMQADKTHFFPADRLVRSTYLVDQFEYAHDESDRVYDPLGDPVDPETIRFLFGEEEPRFQSRETLRLNQADFPAAAQDYSLYVLRPLLHVPEDQAAFAKRMAFALQWEILIMDFLDDQYDITRHHSMNAHHLKWNPAMAFRELDHFVQLFPDRPHFLALVNDRNEVVACTILPPAQAK